MALNKGRIGELVRLVDERNAEGINDFRGLDINKEFIFTKANTAGLDKSKYKVVRSNRFVFSGMQTGRDGCIRIGMSREPKPFIVSPAYATFDVANGGILPAYLFMQFLSPEMDRRGWFCSDGSVRANLDWDVFCNIEVALPSTEIQLKYAAIYESMLANQLSYEQGLNDLKLACDIEIEQLVHKEPSRKLKGLIVRHDIRNKDNSIRNVKGVSTSKAFRDPTAKVDRANLSTYKIVRPRWFSFVQTTHNEKCFAFAFNNTGEDIVVTSVNEVFSVDEVALNPEFLAVFLNRVEFDRFVRYHSWGSARETFTWTDLEEVVIPFPRRSVQDAIAQLYNAWMLRREINERLKAQIRGICPVLIRGSIEEALR